jgi:oxygen-independent coproporphyrinogen-3 oxidase
VWKNYGINRLSIGVQSFKQSDLDWMNRAHTVCEAENCIRLAQQSGIGNLSIDLIYGLPHLSMDEWETHLQILIQAKVPHISAYCLTVEPKTALNQWVKNKQLQLPTDELQAQQFELLQNKLENAGYEQYEISNFSLPGCYSKHNTNYWKNKAYLGIGPSAHSFTLLQRRWNIANNRSYIKHIHNQTDYFEWEELTPKNRFNELILTGLRTKWGVSLDELFSIKAADVHWQKKLNTFVQQGDILLDNNNIRLCKKSLLKADYISSELFDA